MKIRSARSILMLAAFFLMCSATVLAQRPASLRGRVTDQLGAVVVGVKVTLTGSRGEPRVAQTDNNGTYRFDNLAPGVYDLAADQKGFASYAKPNLNLSPGANNHDFQLAVTIAEQRVTVDDTRALTADPEGNQSARMISGKDLNTLSDDPDELAAQLTALAGPAAGPNGTQVFVDGFTAQVIPDKQSISQIVINQNPFSAEFERIGFGTIQIFTRPGTGAFHGSTAYTFSDAAFNARNPYAINKPAYHRGLIEANLNGPLGKKATFFVGFNRRDIDDTAVIAATTLDAQLNPIKLNLAVVTPRQLMSVSPRLDFALHKNNTLSVRYFGNFLDLHKQGIGGFSLPSRAFDYSDRMHIVQVTDMAIVSPRIVNEFGFQYIWYYIRQTPADPSSALIVNDAFSGGGAQIGNYSFKRHEDEFRDYLTITGAAHTTKFGVRYRWAHISDIAPANFGGSFIFTSLDQYRNTLLNAATPAQLIIAGGNPFAEVRQWDVGPFVQDDWKVRPNFTVSGGLRYQYQMNLKSKLMFAPRASFAWTPWFDPKGQPKTVIRGGAGIFYDLVRTSVTLQTNRFDGQNEQQYIVTNPALLALFPATPSNAVLAALNQPQTIWQRTRDLTQPYYLQSSISLERSLPRNTILSISYVGTKGLHQLRSRNLNAPAPITGLRPNGNAFNIYDYETTGWFRQNLLEFNIQSRLTPKMNFNVNYTFGKANGDADGAGSFPSDSYNLTNEYNRSTFDVRHRLTVTGSFETFWRIGFFPLLIAQSGAPFNITTGLDNNADSLFTDRPAFATDLSRPSVRRTIFGNFDLAPLPGAQIIPRNYGYGPSYISLNMRFARTFGFGAVHAPARAQAAGLAKATTASRTQPARPEDKPYKLILSVYVANLFNHNNPGTPIGNLSSPQFGMSNSLSQISQFTFGAGAAQSNRSVSFRAQFAF